MPITDWKFTTKEGLVLDEYTDYPSDIKTTAKDMEMPENALSYAKVSIYHEDLHDVVFHLDSVELPLPADKILTFNPFERLVCDGMSGDEGESGELFYLLDGDEFPLKKKLAPRSQDLKILQRLQELNTN